CFNSCQQMPDGLTALVVVMLYDFQDRKFQSWEPIPEDGEDLFKEVRRVEGSLFRFRTKLAAALARSRIKKNLPSIDDILPTCVRAKHQRKHKLPIYAWVNTLKTNVDEVCETLKAQGFIQGNPHTHLEGSMFSKDTHCPDILRFPQQVPGLLNRTTLLMDHKIIIQNKSRCLAACAVRRLLVKDADILMVGFFSAHTVAHVAVQASVCSAHIYLCGYPDDPTQREELHYFAHCQSVMPLYCYLSCTHFILKVQDTCL
uniref:NOL1/NOP2/NSUN 5/7 ferredoxin-like domain-containing protein n=1 Tax=Electrophorus electricus TaxID=8005 RepID=A0A4W4H5M7_ELEEL